MIQEYSNSALTELLKLQSDINDLTLKLIEKQNKENITTQDIQIIRNQIIPIFKQLIGKDSNNDHRYD